VDILADTNFFFDGFTARIRNIVRLAKPSPR
jgi:hypothetical protein